MAGEHIRKAEAVTALSDSDQVNASGVTWVLHAATLSKLKGTLEVTAAKVKLGFSDGAEGDPEGTAERGSAAFLALSTQVGDRSEQMKAAGGVLIKASGRLRAVEQIRDNKYVDPGAAPTKPNPTGMTDDDYDAAKKQYDQDKVTYDQAASTYDHHDESARIALANLDEAYGDASAVLAEIHGDPVYPEDLPPAGNTPGGTPGVPIRRGTPPTLGEPEGTYTPPGYDPGDPDDPTRPPYVVPPSDPFDPWDPGNPGDFLEPGSPPVGPSVLTPVGGPGGAGGGGGGVNPFAAGAVGAGVAGMPGLANAVRGLLGGGGVPGQSVGRIGASSRTAGAGSLGRSGVGTPGSQAGRGAGGRTGGRAGGRGAAGAAGGRGARSGAGAAGAAGGRGRRKGEENDDERDLFDDGSDWIDDEGTAPGVLS